jgi:hypothetical protein
MRIIIFITYFFSMVNLAAQDSTTHSNQTISDKYLTAVSSKAADLEDKLDKKTKKALAGMVKEEARIKRKLQQKDSLLANSIFGDAKEKYQSLEQKLETATSAKPYIPFLDTLKTSIHFLEQNPELIAKAKEVKEKLTDAMSKVKGLEDQFQKAESIKKFLKERKQYLKEQLSKLGFAKQLKKINKQVYYYSQQVAEYKAILKDPKKAERKAIELLSKTKFFQDFMRKNSMLASLFRMPVDPNDPMNMVSMAGLQTRAQVSNLIQQQIAAGGPNAQQQFQRNLESAQSQLNQLKEKLLNKMPGGGGSSDDIMPEGFKPNTEKTKSFLNRLEYSATMQSQKSTNFFPTTSDIGLNIGYKPNQKSVIGIGASYKLGLGRGWDKIKITNEGIGLRSFADLKLKGSFWFSAGYEMNFRSAFQRFDQLQNYSGWQRSGLAGLSKVVDVRSKFFKKTKAQVLWDFLSYQQVPRTQPIVFRIGYNF